MLLCLNKLPTIILFGYSNKVRKRSSSNSLFSIQIHFMNDKKYIDFIGIGTQKSGTSWLYHNLKQLPEFSLPPMKEFHYFDRYHYYPSYNGLSEELLSKRILQKSYLIKALINIFKAVKNEKKKWSTFVFYWRWFFSNYTDEWYLSLFERSKGYTGEITPSYSVLSKEDIQKIYDLQPDVRLILMLRNPIERAWSHFRFSMLNKGSDISKIELNDIVEFMESDSQSVRSDYVRTIENYSSIFPRNQLIIGFYDAIIDDPEGLMNAIISHTCGGKSISTESLDFSSVINKSKVLNCPEKIDSYLKTRYYQQIKELSDRYGGYFTHWLKESYEEYSNLEVKSPSPTIYP